MINVLYFASFREVLGKSDETLNITENQTVASLITQLAQRGTNWQKALELNNNLQIAVNHDIVGRNTKLKSGDEIAFFPPITGG